jgi:Zn-dependent M28 family amino/carboxypeptidase
VIFALLLLAQLHPQVSGVVDGVSEERIAAVMQKLESFGTRDIHSGTNAAARAWIEAEFQAMSPRLEVSLDRHAVAKKGRVQRDLEVVNVVAKLPGKVTPDVHVLIMGHYDTIALVTKPAEKKGGSPVTDYPATARAPKAPGVSDNASGVAAVLELARLMSAHEWDKTLVFIATSGEEYGLYGAQGYANAAKKAGMQIEAVLNNDIIGNDDNGQGLRVTNEVRLFSEDPGDSPSRTLARYVRETAGRYVPDMKVETVFRPDRFGRGGDHTPFNRIGYAAVRFSTVAEDLLRQHTPKDDFAHASPAYCARVTRVNGAALASLALAPRAPQVNRDVTKQEADTGYTFQPNLARGAQRRDAVLKWKESAGATGYKVVTRSTTAPYWEREIAVGQATEYTLKNLSIDDIVIGIKAVNAAGVDSLVAPYVQPPRPLNNNAAP